MLNKKDAFTLIELLVVVTIIAILAVVWFFSYQWHTLDARNSARLEDLSNINKSLNIFISKSWYFPKPDDSKNITYSWTTIFIQWVFWENTKRILWDLSKLPIDPITLSKYSYSILKNNDQFELATVLEWDSSNLSFINKWYAQWDREGHTYTYWNYNWKVLSLRLNNLDKILAIPSLIVSNSVNTDIISILNNNDLTYKWLDLLPSSYINTSFINQKFTKKLVNTWSIVVFNGDFKNLINNWTNQITFLWNLQKAYSWTYLSGVKNIKYILDSKLTNSIIAGDTARRILSKAIFKNIKLRE